MLKPDIAIRELTSLRDAAMNEESLKLDTPAHEEWKAKALAVLESSLPNSSTTEKFKNLSYWIGIYSGAPGEQERDAAYFRSRVAEACGYLSAAVYELQLLSAEPAVEGTNYDSGLWDHVKHSVEEERWEQVASAAVIYVEDKIRRWAGNPQMNDGAKLYGQPLVAQVLRAGGQLALGSQASETEGWRNLGIGLFAAVGNVDRHGIQQRADVRQYAIGVLGLASLILTQIKHDHPAAAAS